MLRNEAEWKSPKHGLIHYYSIIEAVAEEPTTAEVASAGQTKFVMSMRRQAWAGACTGEEFDPLSTWLDQLRTACCPYRGIACSTASDLCWVGGDARQETGQDELPETASYSYCNCVVVVSVGSATTWPGWAVDSYSLSSRRSCFP